MNIEHPTSNIEHRTGAAPAALDEAVRIAAFIRRRWPLCRLWERGNLVAWVAWFAARGFLHAVTETREDGRERLVGVAMGRPVSSIAEATSGRYAFTWQPGGPKQAKVQPQGVWIDLLVTHRAGGAPRRPGFCPIRRVLWSQFIVRFGFPEWVGFERETHDARGPRMYAFEDIDRRLGGRI